MINIYKYSTTDTPPAGEAARLGELSSLQQTGTQVSFQRARKRKQNQKVEAKKQKKNRPGELLLQHIIVEALCIFLIIGF